MTLDARIVVRQGDFTLDAELQIAEGEVLAVLGPNGSGKSTIVRAICGLHPIDAGRIVIDGRIVDEADSDTFVMPDHRHTGVVFQDHSLFANLSALENIAFGLRARRTPKSVARETAARWLDRIGLSDLANSKPSQLSGGQAQRVALARALAVEPRLLLLDEPMSALDVRARAEVRRDLRAHLDDRPLTTLLITHDPVDAFALADRVMVIEDGRVTQTGSLDDVTSHPRSRHIADMVGLTLVRGEVRENILTTSSGAILVVPADTPDGPSVASIRPGSITLHLRHPEGSARNVWSMTVRDVDRHPDRVRIRLDGPVGLVAELTPAGHEALGARVGDTVWASVKASEISVSPDLHD